MNSAISSLSLQKTQQGLLVKEAERTWPNEACALLLGSAEKGKATVAKVILANNIDHSPVSFRIEPQLLVRLYLEAEEARLDVIGIFHSHPAPVEPSGVDLEYMRVNPTVWLILSMPSKEMKAFQLIQGVLKEVALVLT